MSDKEEVHDGINVKLNIKDSVPRNTISYKYCINFINYYLVI